jgi:hypothetical protein
METFVILRRTLFIICYAFIGFTNGFNSNVATAQVTAIYDASPPTLDPWDWWDWFPHNIGPGTSHQGSAVTNDAGSGLNAWAINDNSTSTTNPFYSQCLDAPLSTGACSVGPVRNAAVQNGWRYSTRARFAADHGTTGSMGLSIWIDNRGYFVLFDLDGSNLRATVFNSPNADSTVVLTTGGVGATSYHDIALVYRPGIAGVTFEFDGVARAVTTGESQQHDNALLWGNLSAAGRGQMNFNRVIFEVMVPGDYNRNGRVDSADYTIWRDSFGSNRSAADGDGNGTVNSADYNFWKNRFGNTGLFNRSTSSVPEPSGLAVLVIIFAVSGAKRRLWRTQTT